MIQYGNVTLIQKNSLFSDGLWWKASGFHESLLILFVGLPADRRGNASRTLRVYSYNYGFGGWGGSAAGGGGGGVLSR